MHYNTLFQDKNLKNFPGRGTAPPQTSPHWGGRNPSPDPTSPCRRLRRLDRRAFGAPPLALSALGFMRPVFSVPIVGNPNCD